MPELQAAKTQPIRRGTLYIVGKRIYAVCNKCDNIIRFNKPLIGSAHLCDPRESRP